MKEQHAAKPKAPKEPAEVQPYKETQRYHMQVFELEALRDLVRTLPAYLDLHTVLARPGTSSYIVIVERIAEFSTDHGQEIRRLGFAP